MKKIFLILTIALTINGCQNSNLELFKAECQQLIEVATSCRIADEAKDSCDKKKESLEGVISTLSLKKEIITEWTNICEYFCNNPLGYNKSYSEYQVNACIDDEIFNIKDERFIKLATISLIMLASFFLTLFGLKVLIKQARYSYTAIKTKGKILDNIWKNKGHTPIIQFTDESGSNFNFEAKFSASRGDEPYYQIGKRVKVSYPKGKQEEAKVHNLVNIWLFQLFPLIFGVVFLFSTVMGLFYSEETSKYENYLELHFPIILDFFDEVKAITPNLTEVKNFKVVDERADKVTFEVDYRLSPFKEGDHYLDVIFLNNGTSNGHWYHSVTPIESFNGKARINLGINENKPDYCSNEIRFSIYPRGGSSFYSKVFEYNKCWESQKK